MDERTYRILEFDKVLQMSSLFAVTEPGGRRIEEIRPLRNIEAIRNRHALLSECRMILSESRDFGIENFGDLSVQFQKIRPSDAVIATDEVRSFLPLLYSALNLKLLSHDPSCPEIGLLVSKLTTHREIIHSIENAIDRKGKVRDDASRELSHVRQNIKSCEKKIRGALGGILEQNDLHSHLQDFYLAERNNRWVIPVKIDSKGKVPGIVHDISNSGETVYMEPYSIQHLGNELELHRAEEKLEEYRILRRLTAQLREHIMEIEEDCRIVADIDALQAVAQFSNQMHMSSPEINDTGHVVIVNGRHPLLWKTMKKVNREKEVVPLNLEVGHNNSCMVITGSNAGGKTVALKTIGVLSLMALSGMHVPADGGTSIPNLESILADIGDEQSIEQSLSTFSAHIQRISEIIRQSNNRTMIIIDELGTGTDPEQGGALSCAILRKIKEIGAIALVSTHLGMLKAFAHAEPGMINSAMEMEEVNHNGVSAYRPTYRLLIGEPGTSHALEIAGSLGLHEDIVRDAREFMADEDAAVESLIAELKQKTGELDSRLKETEEMKQEVEQLRSQLKRELSEIKNMKSNALLQALGEAEDIIRNARRETKEIISAMKKSRPSEAANGIKKLDKRHEEIKEMKRLHSRKESRTLEKVSNGQHVFVPALGTHGTVNSVNKKTGRCTVIIEGKEIVVPASGLSEPSGESKSRRVDNARDERMNSLAYSGPGAEIEGKINIVGQRVDPALSLIERYLNDAAVSGLKEVKIIHGIGAGILSRAVRDFLKDHPLVESSRKGTEDEGGEAVTMVFM